MRNYKWLDIPYIYADSITCLNVFFVLQQRCLHDVAESEVLRVEVECVSGELRDAVPVPLFHRLVGHQLEQRARLAEVVDLLLQVKKGLPLLQTLR